MKVYKRSFKNLVNVFNYLTDKQFLILINKTKKYILISTILFFGNPSVARNDHNLVYTGPPDYYLLPDYLLYEINKPKIRLEIVKEESLDQIKKFELKAFDCVFSIDEKALKKIVSPKLSELKVTKPFNINRITVTFPFYYYSKEGVIPSDSEFSIKDNLVSITVEHENYEFALYLVEKDNQQELSEGLTMQCDE